MRLIDFPFAEKEFSVSIFCVGPEQLDSVMISLPGEERKRGSLLSEKDRIILLIAMLSTLLEDDICK